ncbi:MAG: phosphodiesterase [Firmicutes bacterium]|nr:phosphodiesterase [Bacillota bacterium]
MKLLIASDIHGSAFYANKLIEAFGNEAPDKMLLLGDILYHGLRNALPRDYNPKAVISLLNNISENILCVRGNCDCEVDQMVLDFPIMSDYCVVFQNEMTIYATHGHIFGKDRQPPMKKGDVLLFGHTHVPECTDLSGKYLINPGSVSIPKENSQYGYMTLSDGCFEWKSFENGVYKTFSPNGKTDAK